MGRILDGLTTPAPAVEDADGAEEQTGGGALSDALATPDHWGNAPGLDWGDIFGNPLVQGGLDFLDTLGRGSRTLLHTGDINQAAEALVDKSAATSVDELKKGWGIGDFNQGEGFDVGDVADFVVNTGIGAGTDPATALTFGTASLGGHAVKSTAAAARAAIGGGRTAAIQAIRNAAAREGIELTLEQAAQRLAKAPSLAEGLRTGERALISFAGKPIIGESAAPAVEAVGKVLGTAGDALEATRVGAPIMKWARSAGNFFSERTGFEALDQLGQTSFGRSASGAEAMAGRVGSLMDAARKSGVAEADLEFAEKIVQARLPQEHAAKVAKLTGMGQGEVESMFKARFKPDEIGQELAKKGYTAEQRLAVGALADELERTYKTVIDAERAAGKEISDLGSGVLDNLGRSREALHNELVALGIPPNRLYRAAQAGEELPGRVDLKALLAEPEFAALRKDEKVAALLEDYTKAAEVAATVPGYVFMRVSREAMPELISAAKNDPSKWRAFMDMHGLVATKADANSLVQALGTAALAGGKIRGTVDAADVARAFMRGFDAKGLEGGAKEVAEAVTKAGKLFESHPGLVISDRIQTYAKAVGHADYVKGVRHAVGEELPEKVTTLMRERDALEVELRAATEGAGKVSRGQGVLFEGAAIGERSVPVQLGGGTTRNTLDDLRFRLERKSAEIEKALERGGESVGAGKVLASRIMPLPVGTDDFLLTEDVARAIGRQKEMLRKPELYSQVFKPLQVYNSVFKTLALTTPATWMRNKLGNLMLRAQQGGLDAESVFEEAKILKLQYAMRGGNEHAAKEAAEIVFDIGNGQTVNGYELVKRAKDLGGIDSGYWAQEFRSGIHSKLESGAGVTGKVRKGFDKARDVASAIENGDKLGHMLVRLRKGDSWEFAATHANNSLMNYRVASPAVQMMRSTGLGPFSSFVSKNLSIQTELLLTRPGSYGALLHAKQSLESGIPGYSEDELPAYIRERFGVAYRRDPKTGDLEFVTLAGVVPAADLPRVANVGGFIQDVLGPLPRELYSQISNRDLVTGKVIKEIDGQAEEMLGMVVDPRLKHAIETLIPRIPGIAQDVEDVASGAKTVGEARRALSAVVPIMPKRINSRLQFDKDLRAIDTDISAAKRRLKELNGRGSPKLEQAYQRALTDLEGRRAKLLGKRAVRVP